MLATVHRIDTRKRHSVFSIEETTMAYKQPHGVFRAYAIINNGFLFSVHPTKKQAKLVFKEFEHYDHFKIVKLTSKS